MPTNLLPDIATLAIDADMGSPQPLLDCLASAHPLTSKDRMAIAWVIERACVKTGRSITDVGEGGAPSKCAAYLAAVGRSERRKLTSTGRLSHHEREIIAQKAIDLIWSDFAAAPAVTVDMVMSIRVADHNSSVASFVHERMRPAVDEMRRFAAR